MGIANRQLDQLSVTMSVISHGYHLKHIQSIESLTMSADVYLSLIIMLYNSLFAADGFLA